MGIKTLASRTIGGLKHTWDEMDYAQHRMLEIRLGLPHESPMADSRRTDINRLEGLWHADPRQ